MKQYWFLVSGLWFLVSCFWFTFVRAKQNACMLGIPSSHKIVILWMTMIIQRVIIMVTRRVTIKRFFYFPCMHFFSFLCMRVLLLFSKIVVPLPMLCLFPSRFKGYPMRRRDTSSFFLYVPLLVIFSVALLFFCKGRLILCVTRLSVLLCAPRDT